MTVSSRGAREVRTRSDSREGTNDYGQMNEDIATNQCESAGMPSNLGPQKDIFWRKILVLNSCSKVMLPSVTSASEPGRDNHIF